MQVSTDDLARARFAVSPLNQVVRYASAEPEAVPSSETDVGLAVRLLTVWPGHRPDFLTPAPEASLRGARFADELDVVLNTPDEVVAADMAGYPDQAGDDIAALAAGDRRARRRLVNGLQEIHDELFGDEWPEAEALLRADIGHRTTELGFYGIDEVLDNLHPRLSRSCDGLALNTRPRESLVVQHGTDGLVLIPTLIRTPALAVKANSRDPLVLIYPIAQARDRPPRPAALAAVGRLVRLMGRSRAAIVLALDDSPGLSTAELGARCGIAASSASEHAAILREAGLLDSYRRSTEMQHALTLLGAQIIRGNWR